MEGWTTKTLQHGAVTLIIRRPILTDQEREKREQAIRHTLAHIAPKMKERKKSNV